MLVVNMPHNVYWTIYSIGIDSLITVCSKNRFFTCKHFRVRSFTGMDWNELNYQNGLPEWTFICVF